MCDGLFGVQRIKVNCQGGWEMVGPRLGRTRRAGASEKDTQGLEVTDEEVVEAAE